MSGPWFRCLLLCSLLAVRSGFAAVPDPLAEPRFEPVGHQGQIAHGVVSALVQDQNGFFWIGTGAGLLRFDGYHFRSQGRAPAGQAEQSLGFVRALLVARDGRIWVGTESDGLAVLDPESEQVRQYRSRAGDAAALTAGTIRALAEDSDGAIWVGTIGGGLDRLDPAGGRFQHFRSGSDFGLDDDRIQSLLVDRRGTLWVGSWRGLSRRAAGESRLTPVAGALHGRIVSQLFEASDGRLWAGTQQGDLLLIDPASGNAEPVAETPRGAGSVYSIAEASPGEVWVGRAGGIELRGLDGRLLRQIRHHALNPAGLASNEVRVLLRDRAGWIWAGSYGGGLQRHNPSNTAIWVRRQDLTPTAAAEEFNVRSILQLDNGEIWFGSNADGVVMLDERLRRRGVLRPGPDGLADGRVAGLAQTRDGSIWLGCDAGLYRLDRRGRVLQHLQAGEGRVRRLVAGRGGELWIATQDGLFRQADGRVERLAASGARPVSGDINALAEAADGTLWVGSEKGLYRLPPGAAELQPVREHEGATLAHASVVGLLIDSRQRLWVDTAAGLHRLQHWDGERAAFERISERHGRGGQAFGANLLEDGRGRIWSQQFIHDPEQDSLYELTAADGVDFGTGWFRAYTGLADGRLLFGGSKGLLVVAPEQFEVWRYAPPLVVTELRIDGRREAAGQLRQGLRLAPGQQRFSIEFAALDFSDPGRGRYAYRLARLERDWVPAQSTFRAASYGNLSPGHYRLQVRATNRSGAWSPHELDIPVEVLPAWWQTWWARGLAALLSLALIYGVVQLRTLFLRRRQLELEQRVSERTRELEALSRALEESSLSDPLTGLRNRRFLTQHIEADVALSLRRYDSLVRQGGAAPQDADLIFFLLDLDNFKSVNDVHGHAAGDALLMQMRARLQPVFREADYLVRWGGEEFLIVARGTARAHAPELAERARAMVAGQPFVLDDGTLLSRSCSVGFACFPLNPGQPRALDWNATIDLADAALYAAKRAGRDRWIGVLGPIDAEAPMQPQPSAEWLGSGALNLVGSAPL